MPKRTVEDIDKELKRLSEYLYSDTVVGRTSLERKTRLHIDKLLDERNDITLKRTKPKPDIPQGIPALAVTNESTDTKDRYADRKNIPRDI